MASRGSRSPWPTGARWRGSERPGGAGSMGERSRQISKTRSIAFDLRLRTQPNSRSFNTQNATPADPLSLLVQLGFGASSTLAAPRCAELVARGSFSLFPASYPHPRLPASRNLPAPSPARCPHFTRSARRTRHPHATRTLHFTRTRKLQSPHGTRSLVSPFPVHPATVRSPTAARPHPHRDWHLRMLATTRTRFCPHLHIRA